MMQPLVARVLIALGFQVVSIIGVDTALTQLKQMAVAQLSTVAASGLQMALLSGCGVALGLIFGAITFRVALWQAENSMKILGVNT
ncbi:DUF2523 family protein [Rhodoferax sp.]|uniref:DUF2523 family protein n=1 Tax=Rhodoferax sp. TaxID=50421 RepID=UPI0025EDD52B|nr:DUF2523 family protein [Rhodoferax sp.]